MHQGYVIWFAGGSGGFLGNLLGFMHHAIAEYIMYM